MYYITEYIVNYCASYLTLQAIKTALHETLREDGRSKGVIVKPHILNVTTRNCHINSYDLCF